MGRPGKLRAAILLVLLSDHNVIGQFRIKHHGVGVLELVNHILIVKLFYFLSFE
jgi:hypothetical protein